VKLGCATDAPVDVIVGGKAVARGTVVAVDGMYGVRISEILIECTAVG
jgi:flagellar motor switch/type III secretory pathway protein FliN